MRHLGHKLPSLFIIMSVMKLEIKTFLMMRIDEAQILRNTLINFCCRELEERIDVHMLNVTAANLA